MKAWLHLVQHADGGAVHPGRRHQNPIRQAAKALPRLRQSILPAQLRACSPWSAGSVDVCPPATRASSRDPSPVGAPRHRPLLWADLTSSSQAQRTFTTKRLPPRSELTVPLWWVRVHLQLQAWSQIQGANGSRLRRAVGQRPGHRQRSRLARRQRPSAPHRSQFDAAAGSRSCALQSASHSKSHCLVRCQPPLLALRHVRTTGAGLVTH